MAPRILVIDNYDSFVYNLVQALGVIGADPVVVRNDAADLDELEAMQPDALLVSPGPGYPSGAGVSVAAIRRFAGQVPVLGVCLGHQAIAEAFGGSIVRAPRLMHGKTSMVSHDGKGVFADLSNPFEATRYHSLVVDAEKLPPELEASAWSDDGVLMGIRHRELPVEGVQFHPESILTAEGPRLLERFVSLVARRAARAGSVRGG
jgi:anthranilate synthase/aminodeoxychorismate synthase-like glutamine amidotransferase